MTSIEIPNPRFLWQPWVAAVHDAGLSIHLEVELLVMTGRKMHDVAYEQVTPDARSQSRARDAASAASDRSRTVTCW